MEKKKKVFMGIILFIIFIGLIIVCVNIYNSYQYEVILKDVQANYNEYQRECDVIGNTDKYVHITRTDENNEVIEGSTWVLTTVSGDVIAEFSTNADGVGGLVGLANGEYYLEEKSVPDGYTLLDSKYKIVINNYDTSYTLNMTNYKYKNVLFMIVANEDGTPAVGIIYHVYDSDNKEIITITTNDKGLAGAKNLATGIYYVSEDGSSNKYTVIIGRSTIETLRITR